MRQLVVHGPQRGQAQQARRNFFMADLGLAELAHDARHRPGLALHVAHGRGAELAAVGFVQRLVLQIAVQEGRVRRVDADLDGLQPVAMPQALEGEAVARWRGEAIESRQGRWCAASITQPRKEHAALLHHRVAALLDARAQRRACGLGRRLQTRTCGIELPAVEGAAYAVAFEAREAQIRAAVRAVAIEQSPAAGIVAKEHEVLAEHTHRLHRAMRHARVEPRIELVEQGHRLPVRAQQCTAWRAGADASDELVLFGLHA